MRSGSPLWSRCPALAAWVPSSGAHRPHGPAFAETLKIASDSWRLARHWPIILSRLPDHGRQSLMRLIAYFGGLEQEPHFVILPKSIPSTA